MRKILFRQIKNSFGRFLAIFAIIALGVGFFSGLRVTTQSILATGDAYLKEKHFFDYELISTLGLTEEDVSAIRALPYVTQAEGSYSTDVLFVNHDGSDRVLRTHMLLSDINQVEVLAGRLPEAPDECLMDATYYKNTRWLGLPIVLSPNNSQETLDAFTYDTYTVVGLIDSPSYLSFQRGNSDLGDGSVASFCYFLPGAYQNDIWTEMYVTVETEGAIFSDAYTASIDAVRGDLEQALQTRADLRYRSLMDEANNQIADAESELADGWSKVDDARQQIADAKKELADAENELKDARKELDDAAVQYSDGVAKLEDAKKEYAEGLKKYEDGLQQYEEGYATYLQQKADGEAQLASAERQIRSGEAELASSKAELNQVRANVEASEAYLPALEAQAAACRETIETLSALPPWELLARPSKAAQLQQARSDLNSAEFQIRSIQNGRAQYDAFYSQYQDGARELANARASLESGRATFDTEIAKAEQELADAKKELDDAKVQLEDGAREIADGEMELADAARQIADGEIAYADGLSQYQTAKSDADRDIADAESEIRRGEQDLNDAEDQIADAKEKAGQLKPANTFALDRTTNLGYVALNENTRIVTGISRVFPLFFFLIAALVCITTMTRMVQEQRTANGTLKALGFTDRAIMLQYLFYAGSASLLGSIIGFLLGSKFLPMVLWRVYQIMTYIDRPVTFILDWSLFAFCVGLYLFCALGATGLVCYRELRDAPAELIRPKAPEAGKRIFLERITALWKRLSFLQKIAARNILRYKRRMVMMIIGIGGCTALLMTGFGIRDSIANVVDYQYEEIQIFDASVNFIDEQNAESCERFLADSAGTVSEAVFLHAATFDCVADRATVSANGIVFEEPLESFVDLHTDDGPLAWPGLGEAVINKRLARELNLSVGDTLQLRTADLQEYTVTVSGIFSNYIYDYVYLSADTYRAAFAEEPEIKTAYVQFVHDETPEEHTASAAVLLSMDDVAGVTVNMDMRVLVGNILQSLDYVVLIVLLCAGALAFIVLYNLTNISINERVREIASLKVLGFHSEETATYIFRENRVLVVIASLFGIPMGLLLLRFVMSQIQIQFMYFDCRLAPISYLFSIGITFLFAAIVHLVLRIKLEKINMAESMKAIE